MQKFKRSLSIGSQGEKFARNMLEKLGAKTEDGDGKIVDFWIFINDKKFSCETKFDVYANKSGNICLEVFNTKLCKPSGIMGTTTDIWITVLAENIIYFSKVESLKQFTKENKPKRELIGVGDNNSHILLYSIEDICGVGLKELTLDNLLKEIL